MSRYYCAPFRRSSSAFAAREILRQLRKKQRKDHRLIYVGATQVDLEKIQTQLSFLEPKLKVLLFPAWDCLPFDRVSPSPEIDERRASVFSALRGTNSTLAWDLLLIPAETWLQKVLPRPRVSLTLKVNEVYDWTALIQQLLELGYKRKDLVYEPGTFALRGSLIDIYPVATVESQMESEQSWAWRLDFFDDELTQIRAFDPISQTTFKSSEKGSVRGSNQLYQATSLVLSEAQELLLSLDEIDSFKQHYRVLHGGQGEKDPLYGSIAAGYRFAGMEHWLPLFESSQELISLYDYILSASTLPKESVSLFYDPHVEESLKSRLELIQDLYQSRIEYYQAHRQEEGVYKALPPSWLYLTEEELIKLKESLQEQNHAAFIESRSNLDFYSLSSDEEKRALSLIELPVKKGLERSYFLAQVAEELQSQAKQEQQQTSGSLSSVTTSSLTQEELITQAFVQHIDQLRVTGSRIVLTAPTLGVLSRFQEWFKLHNLPYQQEPLQSLSDIAYVAHKTVAFAVLDLEEGFKWQGSWFIPAQAFLGAHYFNKAKKRRTSSQKMRQLISEMTSLQRGDLLVHRDHGLGRFTGLDMIELKPGFVQEVFVVSYAGGDKVLVPVENAEVLSRYGAGGDAEQNATLNLDRLGKRSWSDRKARVRRQLKDMVAELMKIAIERRLKGGEKILWNEANYQSFVKRFHYVETEDQLQAIEDIRTDFESGQAMDRLVCGDVGFGKTEVALRAAFIAAIEGYQVALAAPTTLLARQHYKTFQERLKGFPVSVAWVSRLVSAKEAKKTKERLSQGDIDILIGTHALFSDSVKFSNLGLLVLDEEQRFGVRQKEKIRQIKENVHVLTLTATPIPRTLQMSLSGIKQLSLMQTPPIDRIPVRTFVMPWDPTLIYEALMRERFRGGQIYVVCPRLKDLDHMQKKLADLVPDLTIGVAHGQMAAQDLETVMERFYNHEIDLLLSTNIVESGLDIASANTILVYKAEYFGLSQLYQLKGRVGRSKQRGYAYFVTEPGKELTEEGKKRLDVLQSLQHLGSGFQLASHDLDLRGSGNILGEEQSGHIKEVGTELYQELFEEAMEKALYLSKVQKMLSNPEEVEKDSQSLKELALVKEGGTSLIPQGTTSELNLGVSVLIPETYVSDRVLRVSLYSRLGTLQTAEEVEQFASELIDRFGALPQETEHLLSMVKIKQLCLKLGIARLDVGPKGVMITFHSQLLFDQSKLHSLVEKQKALSIKGEHKLFYAVHWQKADQILVGALRLVLALQRSEVVKGWKLEL